MICKKTPSLFWPRSIFLFFLLVIPATRLHAEEFQYKCCHSDTDMRPELYCGQDYALLQTPEKIANSDKISQRECKKKGFDSFKKKLHSSDAMDIDDKPVKSRPSKRSKVVPKDEKIAAPSPEELKSKVLHHLQENRFNVAKALIRKWKMAENDVLDLANFVFDNRYKPQTPEMTDAELIAQEQLKASNLNRPRIHFIDDLIQGGHIPVNEGFGEYMDSLPRFAFLNDQYDIMNKYFRSKEYDPYIEDDSVPPMEDFEFVLRNSSSEIPPGFLQALIEREDFDPNRKASGGEPLAILAFDLRTFHTMEELLRHPLFDPNRKDAQGNTLAHHLVQYFDDFILRSIKNLADKGADFSLKNNDGIDVIQMSKNKGSYRYLKSIIDSQGVREAVEKVVKGLTQTSQLAPSTLFCRPDEVMTHISYRPVERKRGDGKECSLCVKDLSEEQMTIKTKKCECEYCPPCAGQMKDHIIHQNGGKKAACDYHHADLPVSFLLAAGSSELETHKYRLNVFKNHFSTVDGFRFCFTPDCPNGALLKKGEERWFKCGLCDKESFLKYDERGEELPDPRSQFRPCPHCRTIFSKDNACNHVTCQNPLCGKKFNFQSGIHDPRGTFSLYDRGPRTYRLEGELNRRTGERYRAYTEGVRPEDDLPPAR